MQSSCVEAEILPDVTSNTTAVYHMREYHILECLLLNQVQHGQVLILLPQL